MTSSSKTTNKTNTSKHSPSKKVSMETAVESATSVNIEKTEATIPVEGFLEIFPDYGVLRVKKDKSSHDVQKDVYISPSQIRKFSLRAGDQVTGFARPPKDNERYQSLLKVDLIDGYAPEMAIKRPKFEDLTPVYPNNQLHLETDRDIFATRLIDLFSPVGRGQRAMIVAPPKAGKTTLLKQIARGISTNNPEVVLMVVLVGERPEEVTDMRRSIQGEVLSSNFDEPSETHVSVAEFALERAKRQAEVGKHVVILLDSMTRLARAYNMSVPPSGRTLSGGFDPSALYPPKRFFGAARNFESSGSLTIIATALVDTGSRMDDLIYEEFKGTGNMELHLDRSLAERRIFPAIDIVRSGTRNEELLYRKEDIDKMWRLRRMVDMLDDRDATEAIIQRLAKTKSNRDFIETLHEVK